MGTYQHLLISFPAPHVVHVRFSRAEAANALNTAIALEIKDFFSSPPEDARCIIVSGEGKHFCAGADLKERHGMDEAAWKAQHTHFRAARDAVMHGPLPVIAAVHGAAFGGGLELALACDFIYADETARFALTEASLGIMPGMGGTQTLPGAVGLRRARQLLYTAAAFSAQEAYAMGMINRLCPADKLMEHALVCAQAIAANAPLAVQAIRQVTRPDMPMERELEAYNRLLATRDRHEGISAFNEKRKPAFTGN